MEVRVPKKILQLRSVMADAQTRPAITLAAERELAWQRSGGDFAGQIRRRLSEQQSSYLSLNEMAQERNTSRRTLSRKLKQEGVTYQRLLDDVRKEVADGACSERACPSRQSQSGLGMLTRQTSAALAVVGSVNHPANFERPEVS
jgi:AraC-like DNA-binding protein